MMTREEIIKLIWEEYEQAKKDKARVWDKSMQPDADPKDEFFRHICMGRESACEILLVLIGELEADV